MTEQVKTAWKKFNDMPTWQGVVLAALLYGGGSTAYDAIRAAWDRMGLNQTVIERIGVAETNIIAAIHAAKQGDK